MPSFQSTQWMVIFRQLSRRIGSSSERSDVDAMASTPSACWPRSQLTHYPNPCVRARTKLVPESDTRLFLTRSRSFPSTQRSIRPSERRHGHPRLNPWLINKTNQTLRKRNEGLTFRGRLLHDPTMPSALNHNRMSTALVGLHPSSTTGSLRRTSHGG